MACAPHRLPPGCVRRMLRLRTPWRKPRQARQNVLLPKAKRHTSLLFLSYTACLVSVTRKAVQPGQRLRCPHVYRTDCPRANSGLGDRDERKTSLYSNCICDMSVYWNCSSRLRGCSVSSGDAFGRRGCCCGRRSGYRLHDGCRHTGPVPLRVPVPLHGRGPFTRLDQEGLPSGRGARRLI